jgi:2-polyprenyl-6-hydroxyphenyl methylase/3-demethylubiquinone-9 3-methyltransferase
MPTIRLNDPDPAVLDGRHIRASAFETAQRQLIDTLAPFSSGLGQPGPRALTIGAGYAALPRFLTDAGYRVTALDPSSKATATAQQRSVGQSAAGEPIIDYRVREPAALPELDDTFDVVWCVDTLEVEPDPGVILAEIARVTRPGGVIVLDTLNDTLVSRAIYLGLFQRFPATRVMPPDRYHRDRLRTPTALTSACEHAGIAIDKIIGYEPSSPIGLLRALLCRRRGKIQDHELADLAQFRLSAPGHTPPVTYYALGTPATPD